MSCPMVLCLLFELLLCSCCYSCHLHCCLLTDVLCRILVEFIYLITSERCSQIDHWLAALWPYHWHAGQSSLAAFFWAHPVQAGDDGVSATAWSHPTVLIRWPSSLGGYPVAATSAVGVFAAVRCAAHSSSDCWRPSVRCCRSDALEQSGTRHYWLCVTDIILPETENFLVFCIISMTTFLVVLENYTYVLCMYVCTRDSYNAGVIIL